MTTDNEDPYIYMPSLRDTGITPGPWYYYGDVNSPFWGEIRSTVNFALIAQQPDGDDLDADFHAMALIPELIDVLMQAPIKLLNEDPYVFIEKYKRWYRDLRHPILQKVKGEDKANE